DEIINIYTSLYRMILPYKGLTVHSSTYSDEYFDEIQFVQQLKDQRVATLDFCYTKVQSLYMTGNYDEALKYADIIFKDFEEGNFGLIYIPEFCFYHTLSLSAHYDSVNKQDKKQYLKIINKNIRKMKVWADNSPDNFLHQYLIMAAELSRIKENDLEAMMLYSQAVKTSQENDYNNHEAIANDLAARFYLSKENKTAAKAYMSEALKCYSKWGATAIVADRRLKYQSLLPEETDGTKPVTTLQSYQPISPSTIIDHVSVVSSLQAISSEIFMENLLKTLMKIVMENSGAQRCIYISLKNDNLFVEAEMSVGSNQVILSENGLLEEKDDLLISVVYYVKRTLQHIVLDDATKEKDYLTDPYVLKSQSKSILCLPVIRQQILVGILYLENNITARAFVPERIEVLKLLASQAAISLENVMLVEDMQKKESGLKESEEKYRSLVEYATDLIMHLDIEGNIQFINHTPLGVKKEDVIGKNVLDFTSNEFHGEIQEAHKYVLKSGEPESYEFLGNVTNNWYSTIISPIIKDGEIIALTLVARDISLRKKAEEKYRTLVEEANDGIAIGQDEYFKYVNPSLAKMLGYNIDEMVNTHFCEYLEPDKIVIFLDKHRRRLAGEDVESIYELKFRHKDGHYIDVEISFSLTEYEVKPAVLVFFRDVTYRKQLENELIAKERLLNFAIEQLPIPVGITNAPDADLSILNQAAIDLMVKPLDNYKGLIINEHREFWPSFHPDGTPYTTDELPLIRAIREGHITRNEEVILRRNDGDRWVSGSAAPLIDEDGKIIAAICAFPDITELKRAEERVKISEELYRGIFEFTNSGVVLYKAINQGKDFIILDSNSRSEEIEQISKNKVIGKRVTEAFPSVQEFGLLDVFRRVWRTGKSEHHPISFYKDDRIQGWRENFVYRLHSGEIAVVYEDVTERKQAEHELTQYREHLEDIVAERTKELEEAHEKLLTAERLATLGQLSGSISHEIRNPLSIIDSSVFYLKKKLLDTDPKVHQHLDRIRKNVKRSSAIIESLLNLTKVKEPDMYTFSLSLLIDDIFLSLNRSADIEVNINIPDDNTSIVGDYELIRIVFRNIIKNAIDAMDYKGTLKIQGETVDEGRFIQITFEDTGPGITPENMGKIFQPLFSTKTVGIGFGLTICQQIIEKHGGTIEVTSKPGHGATFIVQLPSGLGNH
ncbi:MAG: PAS domain S-box protein, partial [Spirochaetota bacterium]|nr:PAS domain S-box protein [Spirochaetota bacterium]